MGARYPWCFATTFGTWAGIERILGRKRMDIENGLGMWVVGQAGPQAGGSVPTPEPKQVVVGMPGNGGSAPSAGTVESKPVGPGTAGNPQQPGPGGGLQMLLPFVVIMGAMILFSVWSQRKEQKRRATMLSAIKKLDKVMLSSGIIGQVIELTDEEAVLRLEEGRVRVARSSIQAVISSPTKANSVAEVKGEGTPAKSV